MLVTAYVLNISINCEDSMFEWTCYLNLCNRESKERKNYVIVNLD